MKNNSTLKGLLTSLVDGFSISKLNSIRLLSKISAKITIERTDKEMNQTEFAEFMNVSQGMVSKWESGSYNFTIKQLCDICEKLDITPNVTFESNTESSVYDPLIPNSTSLNTDEKNKFGQVNVIPVEAIWEAA